MIDFSALPLLAKFRQLRPQQTEVLNKLMVSPHRVDVAALPTGTGKSLLGVVYALNVGLPTVILTSTRGLQDQYQMDFEYSGVYDVRGMSNYPCKLLENLSTCDAGPCLDGDRCVWRDAGCAYYDRVRIAKDRLIVVTNYAFWFKHLGDDALGRRELVILDEAHELADELAGAAGVELNAREVEFEPDMESWGLGDWNAWAAEKARLTQEVMNRPSTTMFERRKLRYLQNRLLRLSVAQEMLWDLQPKWVRFEPADIGQYMEPYLMRQAPKVLMMSATVRPDMVSDLGVQDFGFLESDSPFPIARRPVVWVETGVRLNASTKPHEMQKWVESIDRMIEPRLHQRGIVHTVSYKRAELLQRQSKYAKHMMLHEPGTAQRVVQDFKAAKAPAILVSPVVHTGYDFPYEQARWQIIGKIPFPDTRTGIAAARAEMDEKWSVKFAARTVVQMAGRVVRAEDDLGETIVVDDNWKFLYSKHKMLFPRWFREAVRHTITPPEPI